VFIFCAQARFFRVNTKARRQKDTKNIFLTKRH